jgi:hypothetical protein
VSVIVPDTPTPEQSGFDGGFFDATATPVEDEGFFGATATPEDGGFFSNTPTPDEGGGFFDDTPTPGVDSTEYTLYQAPEGGWSLEYPSDWTVDVEEPNYQFSNAEGDAFVQETYAPLDSSMANEDLAQIASEQFQDNFENYVESGQVEQSDGSYRIDFKFDASDGADTVQWDAQAFVEAHQQHVYMLMLATTEDAYEAGTYDEIIGHIIDSYRVPSE